MKTTAAVAALTAALAFGSLTSSPLHARQQPPAPAATAGAALDTRAIDTALGFAGTAQGDVHRAAWPRTDLTVTTDGVTVKPGLALGSWAAFKRTPTGAVVHGDLVLLEPEINPVISKLQAAGLDITALHNHLAGESPRLMYLHYWGAGTETALATAVRDALATTKTPMRPNPASAANTGAAASQDAGFDVDAVQRVIGRTGTERGGVLGLSIPRPEKITMMGVDMPPAMGMATAINLQSDGAGKVVATGDFVMTDDEVNKVARALRANNIAITSLHNHMLHGTPMLYFMHFWAHGTADQVATGLKAAVDQLAK